MQQMMERVISSNTDAYIAKQLQIASATQDPRAIAVIDWMDYSLGEAYAAGVPTKYLRKPNEVKQELSRLQQVQQQQAAMQQAAAAANRDNAAAENYRAQYGQSQ